MTTALEVLNQVFSEGIRESSSPSRICGGNYKGQVKNRHTKQSFFLTIQPQVLSQKLVRHYYNKETICVENPSIMLFLFQLPEGRKPVQG